MEWPGCPSVMLRTTGDRQNIDIFTESGAKPYEITFKAQNIDLHGFYQNSSMA